MTKARAAVWAGAIAFTLFMGWKAFAVEVAPGREWQCYANQYCYDPTTLKVIERSISVIFADDERNPMAVIADCDKGEFTVVNHLGQSGTAAYKPETIVDQLCKRYVGEAL